MMKYLYFCGTFLFSLLTFAADSGEPVFWHDPMATYRIHIRQEASDVPAVLDDRRLCLPASLKNNVRVFDPDGNVIPAHYFADGAVFLPPVTENQEFYLYFGYGTKKANPSFYGLDTNRRLSIYQSAHLSVYHTKDWRNFMIRQRRERYNNFLKWYKYTPCTNHRCGYLMQARRNCRYSLMPFCAWHVMFRYQKEKTLLWADDPLLKYQITCCRPLMMRQDFALMPGNHGKCRFNRVRSHINRFVKERTAMTEDIRKINATPPEQGMEDSLLNVALKSMQRGVLDSGQIFMTRRPTDTGLRSLLHFRGKLQVPVSGNYTFRVSSNATHLLVINGKCVMRRFAENMPRRGETHTDCTLKLEKGLHDFLLCYHKQSVGTWIYAAWKKPGAPVFEILSEENFSPGIPVIPLAIESQSGFRYPIVFFQDKFNFYTSKLGRKTVRTFDGNTRYLFDGKEYPQERNLFLTEPGNIDFVLLPNESGLSPMKIAPHPRKTERISLHVSLDLLLHLPDFIYDDEKLNGTWEIRSRLPFPVRTVLTRTPGESTTISLPAHQSGGIDRFSPDFLLKKDFPLWNTGYKDFRYELSLPGMTFRKCGVQFRRPDAPGNFTYRYGNFYAENGDKILFVLHRPQLHELRKWSLAHQLTGGLRKTSKLCMIADLNDEIKEHLRNTFRKSGIDLKIIPAVQNGKSTGSPLPENLCNISKMLKMENPDTVLIIPPSLNKAENHSMRTELRCIAFLVEQAKNMKSIHRVLLTTPFPDKAVEQERQKNYASQLRSLKRDYGIFMLELSAYLANTSETEYKNKTAAFLLNEF